MKIEIHTPDAKKLKTRILKDAKDGDLCTWDYRSNNDDSFITHSPEQWADKVILVFTPSDDNKMLSVVPSFWKGKYKPVSDEMGTIMGRFAERLWIQYRGEYTSFESFA